MINSTLTPHINKNMEKGKNTAYYLAPVNSQWRKLAEFPKFDPKGVEPLAGASDGNLYVTSNS
ncbi:hypothetical protein [Undibacterium sp. RuRC25W]|uniref:hypothetical protein n=1 Tax=Undibacterium sp. RuRC25W TaxID=3413047 RepID=UPI003BF1B2F5